MPSENNSKFQKIKSLDLTELREGVYFQPRGVCRDQKRMSLDQKGMCLDPFPIIMNVVM